MKIEKVSFAAGEITPALHGRTDLAFDDTGLSYAKNVIVRKTGGIVKRGGTEFVAECHDNAKKSRLIDFDFGIDQTYAIELADQMIRVVRDGGLILTGSAKSITGATQADPVVITSTAHGFANGQRVFITGVDGMTEINDRWFLVANQTANTFELQDLYGANVDGAAFTAYTSGGTADIPRQVTAPFLEAELFDIGYAASRDVTYMGHWSHQPRRLVRSSDTAWALSNAPQEPTAAAPTNPTSTFSSGGGTATQEKEYKVTTVLADTGEESNPTAAFKDAGSGGTGVNALAWDAMTGADFYNVYKEKNGIFGWIGRAGSNSFSDTGFDPDTTNGPPDPRTPFNASGDYYEAVAIFEQRLIWASSENDPPGIEMSRTGLFQNYTFSDPGKATDAISTGAGSRKTARIRHLLSLRKLIALTSNGIFLIEGTENSVLTPAGVKIEQQTERGVSGVRPVIIGNAALYVQDDGRTVRDLAYSFQEDAVVGTELSAPSEHLFEGKSIVDKAYQESPDSVVWYVLSDGTAAGLTYMRDHEVFGWVRVETDGEIESVTVIKEDGYSAPYFTVKRTINGNTRRFIERLRERDTASVAAGFYLDCAIKYSGSATRTITGLWHLEGQTVSALADGDTVRNLTVSNGQVELEFPASVVVVGLEYEARARLLPIKPVTQAGPTSHRTKGVGELFLRIHKTPTLRGGLYDPDAVDDRHLERLVPDAPENYDDDITATTGVVRLPVAGETSRDAIVELVSPDPVHFEILTVTPGFRVGG